LTSQTNLHISFTLKKYGTDYTGFGVMRRLIIISIGLQPRQGILTLWRRRLMGPWISKGGLPR
jgi:hypothetical protein